MYFFYQNVIRHTFLIIVIVKNVVNGPKAFKFFVDGIAAPYKQFSTSKMTKNRSGKTEHNWATK